MNTISLIIKGMVVGIANIIPGVSGGTMAFILGIYKQLSEAIGYFLIRPEKRKEYILFLAQLMIGVIIGFLLFAKLISFLLGVDLPEGADLPFSYVPTFGFFLGLIIGSIPVLLKLQEDTKVSVKRIILVILGFGLIFGIGMLKEGEYSVLNESTLIKDFGLFKLEAFTTTRLLWLGFIGILAAATMVVPGVSGSALLLALGEYGNILYYIKERSLMPIAMIGGGVAVGLILTTLLMSKLLEKRAGATFFFIMGLILASCVEIIVQMTSAPAPLMAWILAIFTTIAGGFIALQSDKLNPKT
ncbi:MAG: DUF368 domain-containing protein [Brevinema sp.]